MAQITNPGLYNFNVFPAAELSLHSSAIEDMQNGNLDGVVIEELIPKEEVAQLTARFKALVQTDPFNTLYYPAPFGHVFGTTLMESDLDGYFRRANQTRAAFEQLFQGRFEATVLDTLSRLGKNFTIATTVHAENATFSTASVRILEPGYHSLEAHIHQEFPMYFPSYQAVNAQLDLATELSYYIVLQKPESGGELVLYDMQWTNTPTEMLQSNVFLTGVRSEDLAQHDQMLVDLDEGDLILFAANRIWHKVAAVTGEARERITIGGFLAKARQASAYQLFI